jgi:hypothetical protein
MLQDKINLQVDFLYKLIFRKKTAQYGLNSFIEQTKWFR